MLAALTPHFRTMSSLIGCRLKMWATPTELRHYQRNLFGQRAYDSHPAQCDTIGFFDYGCWLHCEDKETWNNL